MDSLASKVMEHDAKIKGVEHRVKNLENEVHDLRELTKAVAVMGSHVEQLTNQFDELHQDVKEIKATPAKRWDKVITAIITGIVGTLIGAVLAVILK